MLSQKTRYALRALAVLAEHGGREPLPIQEIAARSDSPRKFLEAILLELRRNGVLKSARGKLGGYQLAEAPGQITLGRVIRILDGPLAPLSCASLAFYRPCEDCPDPEICSTRRVMREVRDAIASVLDQRTLLDLAGPAPSPQSAPEAGPAPSPQRSQPVQTDQQR